MRLLSIALMQTLHHSFSDISRPSRLFFGRRLRIPDQLAIGKRVFAQSKIQIKADNLEGIECTR